MMDGSSPLMTAEIVDAAFAPLTPADHDAARRVPAHGADHAEGADEMVLLPCPDQSPALHQFCHQRHGDPANVWFYRDTAGSLLCVMARYDLRDADGLAMLKADGRRAKAFAPWVYGRRIWTGSDGRQHDRSGWHCKAPPTPRPLYGLDRLAAHPDAPVLVVEGEKAADAAAALFPDHVAITPMNGAEAPGRTDWSALMGRRVTIWPDNDTPGTAFATQVAALVTKAGAAVARIVALPAAWPVAWDLADPVPDGMAVTRLRTMLNDAAEHAVVELPSGFTMKPTGLFYEQEPTKNNPDGATIWVSGPFEIVGETRTGDGKEWGVLLRWRDREGGPHQWAIPRRMVHQPGNEIAAALENAGLSCGSDARAHQLLKHFINTMKASRLLRCVDKTGWHNAETGPVFVMPGGETFGRGAADVVLQAEHAGADARHQAAGDLAGWQELAALAKGNDRLLLFVSAAFAGPLLDITGEPSGGLHLYGDSRTGKSTVVALAASVWGEPVAGGQMRTWRGTANGLEGVAADTNGTLLILDEMGQADPREVGDVVYMLANEAGKQRASRNGRARRPQSWQTLFLSTGELTLAQKMSEGGKRSMAGLDVRLVDLPADAGAGNGVFQDLHGRPSAAALAEDLKEAAKRNYGTAASVFVDRLAWHLADDSSGLRQKLMGMRDAFIARNVPAGATGQVRSVAGRIALIGAAGELAREYGILTWPEGEAMRAASVCFADWMMARGGPGPAEDIAATAQVRAFLEAHGESRFTLLSELQPGPMTPDGTRTFNRAGFRRRSSTADGGEWEYLIFPEAWKEMCGGLDPKRTAKLLVERGWLLATSDRDRTTAVNIQGEGKRRVYRVSSAILSA